MHSSEKVVSAWAHILAGQAQLPGIVGPDIRRSRPCCRHPSPELGMSLESCSIPAREPTPAWLSFSWLQPQSIG